MNPDQPPGIEDAPVVLLQILQAMTQADDWTTHVAWRAQDGYEYWQLVGCWRDTLRLQGWWRSSDRDAAAPDRAWHPCLQAVVRAPGHDMDDFAALEPVHADLDRPVDAYVPLGGVATAIAQGPDWAARMVRLSVEPIGR